MIADPKAPRYTSGETGLIPRVDSEPEAAHEPPHPPTVPEFDDSGGITGVVRIKAEGEDRAKHNDDTSAQTG
jgi:hypothetical protein